MSTRDKLIETTQALLSTKGYEATSPSDIQKRSGVGQGSFYHHFATKADLAAAALHTLAAQMCADFDQLTDQAGADQIAAYLSAERDPLAGCRIGRITMEHSISDDRIREPIGAYFEHLREQLSAAFDHLDNGIDSIAMADLAIATVQGGFVLSRATGDSNAMSNATSALATLISVATSRN